MAGQRLRKHPMSLESKLKRNTEASISSSQLQKFGQLAVNRSSRSLSVSKYRGLIASSIHKAKHEERRLPVKKTDYLYPGRSTPENCFDTSFEYDKLERLTNRYESARNDLLTVQQQVLEFDLRGKLQGKGLYEVSEEHEDSFSKLDKSFNELVGRYFPRQEGLPRLTRGSLKPVGGP